MSRPMYCNIKGFLLYSNDFSTEFIVAFDPKKHLAYWNKEKKKKKKHTPVLFLMLSYVL